MNYQVIIINTASVFKNVPPKSDGKELSYNDAVGIVESNIRHSKAKFSKINKYIWEADFEDGKIILVICRE